MKVSLFTFNEPNLRKNSQSLKKFQTWDSPCQHEVENSDRNFDLPLSQSCGKFYKNLLLDFLALKMAWRFTVQEYPRV